MVFASFVAGVLFGIFVVGALAVLSRLRHLIFASMTANADGTAAIMARVPALEQPAQDFRTTSSWH